MSDLTSAAARLDALRSYGILDTPREPAFDEIVAFAAALCAAPVSVVNLIEDRRQWFKAEVGLGIRETPLDVSICKHVVLQPGLTIIPDLRDDNRMSENPLVKGDQGFHFYAGYSLTTPAGHGIGTLCVLDRRPRHLSPLQQQGLTTLANQVMAQMALRRALNEQAQLLEQKEMLLTEVNHRNKNNLQLIVSLIDLQARRLTDDAARAALTNTSQRVRSIASVHDQLYRAEQAEAVDAATYLATIVDGMKAAAGNVSFSTDFDRVMMRFDDAFPLALIVNEMVTNALKYAFAANATGQVDVSLKVAGRQVVLTVADDGYGLPAQFDSRNSRSLGMKIIHSLARQLNASVEFQSPGKGLTCRMVFARVQSSGSHLTPVRTH
ncbi:MAG: ATP-binding protein [Burkholderiaceae bacterium]|nr:ATP-binding protein [Burkholderiaceae bacterium]